MSVHPALPPLPEGNWPAQGDWTYEDYVRLPETPGARFEVIYGVLYMAITPEILHQIVVREISNALWGFVRERGLGTVLFAPVEVRLPGVADPVQPDALFVRSERREIIGRQYVLGAPDLVVEVLSPGTWRTDRHVKFDAYEQGGVREYWIANPKTRTVEVNVLEPGAGGEQYVLLGEYGPGEMVQSRVLEGFAVDAGTFFAEAL